MSSRLQVLLPLAAALAAGCAGRPLPPRPSDPRGFPGRAWESPIGRDHPLTGFVLAPREERWVDAAELGAAVAAADWLYLGETHDNADHHRLQAELVAAATAGGRRPALAFEMLDTAQAAPLEAAQAGGAATADAIAEAVGWAKSGWPDFSLYRPIVAAGLERGLGIVAANLPRPVAREAVRKGNSALPDELRAAMERAGEPSPADLRRWAREMEENHCQEVDPAILPGLVRAQRARDAQMALRIAAAGAGGRGAILVTGDGHARSDRGVPVWMERHGVAGRGISVGLIEVDPALPWPRQYAEPYATERLPFDFVVFTPRAEREDPCEALRRRSREGAKKEAAPREGVRPAAGPAAGEGAR